MKVHSSQVATTPKYFRKNTDYVIKVSSLVAMVLFGCFGQLFG